MDGESAATTCGACEKARARYACPKCGARLCALACYERHNDGKCQSRFHEDALASAMRGMTATAETKREMMETLRRRAVADGTLDLGIEEEEEEGDDDDDGERCVLSEASLEVLRAGGELDLEALNEEERASFERAVASGELVEAWVPWWESPEAGRTRASARGERAVAELDLCEPTTSEGANDKDKGIPPLASADEALDPFERLSGGKEAPEALRWHCVNALSAYVLVKRSFNGDWSDEEEIACDAMLELSAVLSAERGAIAEAQCARDAALDVVRRAPRALPSSPSPRALQRALTADLRALFAAPTIPIRALLDLSRALDVAARASASDRARRRRAALKSRYLCAYLCADALGVVTADVARAVKEIIDDDLDVDPDVDLDVDLDVVRVRDGVASPRARG